MSITFMDFSQRYSSILLVFGANRGCFTPKCSTWTNTLERGKTDLKMLPISLPAAIFHGNSLAARKT